MNFIKALFMHNEGERLWGPAIIYFIAAVALVFLIQGSLDTGTAYLKHGQEAPLDSGLGKYVLVFQGVFLLACTFIGIVKFRRNLAELD